MKTLKIFLLFLFVGFSCFSAKSTARENADLKKITIEGVTVPMKVRGATIPDFSFGSTVCSCTNCPEKPPYIALTRFGFLQGFQTHGGIVNSSLSRWEIVSCSTNFGTLLNTSMVNGTNVVANGDSYTYRCLMTIHIVTQAATLEVEIVSGTGRFEGATGRMTLNGVQNPAANVVTFEGEGYITFR